MQDERHEVPRSLYQSELDAELLAEAVGRGLIRNPEHPVWRDDRFLAWLAAEARARAERRVRVSEEVLVDRGEQLMAKAQANKLRVSRRGNSSPVEPAMRSAESSPASTPHGAVAVVELGIAAGVGRELWDEPVQSWVELPPDMPPGKYVALKIVGESMAPLMHTGDTVLVRIGADVKRDTVVVARHPEDGYVCKRVSRVRRDAIELSSLEPGRPIITIPRDPSLMVGTVVLVWCQHRK